jgi:hypothetical protein
MHKFTLIYLPASQYYEGTINTILIRVRFLKEYVGYGTMYFKNFDSDEVSNSTINFM